jgi:hypothetical protein
MKNRNRVKNKFKISSGTLILFFFEIEQIN